MKLLAILMLLFAPGCFFGTRTGTSDLMDLETRADGRIQIYSLKKVAPRPEGPLPLAGRSQRPLATGLDALAETDFELLRGKSFALLTNATGLNRELEPGIELMLRAGIRPQLLFEPEHGIFGAADIVGPDGIRVDPQTGLKIMSLYSSQRRPPANVISGLDYLVVDIQNLPVRCYTYASTLTYLLETAAQTGTPVLILDRPNPFGFMRARGPYPREELRSFVGYAPVPFLYSLTVGEYSLFLSEEILPNLKLTVFRVGGYSREDTDAALRNSWINPSPNIPSPESALVYTGMVFFEGTNVSLGRGTTRPFIYSGAPWMRSSEVIAEFRKLQLPGVQIAPVVFTPTFSLYTGVPCYGVQLHPVSVDFDPIRTGYELMRIIHRLHPGQFTFTGGNFTDRLWGSDGYRTAVIGDLSYKSFERTWIRDSENFEDWMKSYRLY